MTDYSNNEAPVIAQDDSQFENYWGVEETFKYYLPDGKQFFEIKPMNEGAKTRFQKLTNKGIKMDQRTNEATIKMDAADERHTLILESVVSWYLMQPDGQGGWSEFPCSGNESIRRRALENEILVKFNPKAVQDLEFFIRTKNPWMQADMDVEEIDKEIERLQELKQQKKDIDAGE